MDNLPILCTALVVCLSEFLCSITPFTTMNTTLSLKVKYIECNVHKCYENIPPSLNIHKCSENTLLPKLHKLFSAIKLRCFNFS